MAKGRSRNPWFIGLGVGGAVVAVVAALVLTLIGTARSILRNAERALDAANKIVENTRPIWELERTNSAAAQLLEEVQSIERHATQVADALEAPEPAAR